MRAQPTPRGMVGFAVRLVLVVFGAAVVVAVAESAVAGRIWPQHSPGAVALLLAGAGISVPVAMLLGGVRLVRRHEQALRAAMTDDATGLGSVSAFRADLPHAVSRAIREGMPLTVGLVDLSGLHEVIAEEGRRSAELLLGSAGGSLRRLSRRDRAVEAYRVGAETFAMILYATSLEDAFTVADAVTRRVSEHAAPLVATVGLSTLDSHRCPDADTLLVAADAALEHARALGGARVIGASNEVGTTQWVTAPDRSQPPRDR
jgi:GGDEF domain-containing protein